MTSFWQTINDAINISKTSLLNKWQQYGGTVAVGGAFVVLAMYVGNDVGSPLNSCIQIGKVRNGVIPIEFSVSKYIDSISYDQENLQFRLTRPSANCSRTGVWGGNIYIADIVNYNMPDHGFLHDRVIMNQRPGNLYLEILIRTANVENSKEWQKYTILIGPEWLIDSHGLKSNLKHLKFYIRVPFCFTSYNVEMKFQLDHPKFSRSSRFSSIFNKIFTIEIPSFLIETDHKTDYKKKERVGYVLPDTSFAVRGRIVEKCINDETSLHTNNIAASNNIEYLIQIEEGYCHSNKIKYYNEKQRLVRAYSNQIQTLRFQLMNGIDTCNFNDSSINCAKNAIHRKNMECQFILGSNNDKICDYYWKLRCIISKMYQNDLSLTKQDCQQLIHDIYIFNNNDHSWRSQLREEIFKYDCISSVISSEVCKYLFDFNNNNDKNSCNYQIQCFANSSFDSKYGMVTGNQSWSSMMQCDICNIGIDCNDWCFQCDCTGNRQHNYCLPCTYTMANEIRKFEKYLDKIIRKYIDQNFTYDCVKILVAFVVGYVQEKI